MLFIHIVSKHCWFGDRIAVEGKSTELACNNKHLRHVRLYELLTVRRSFFLLC